MNEIINQVKRLFSDDGRDDKDFTEEEVKLKVAKDNLDKAILAFQTASNALYDALMKS